MHGVATPGRRMTWPNRSGGQLNPTPRHAGTIRPRLDYFVVACAPQADRYASGHARNRGHRLRTSPTGRDTPHGPRERRPDAPSAARTDELLHSRSQFARATLSNMAFNVLRPSEPSLNFTDDERLEIVDGGVLKICRADGTNLYINPGMWASIEEEPSPSAGPSPKDGRPPGR